jgi:Apea-like HEPN
MKSYMEIPLPYILPLDEDKKIISAYEDKYFRIEFQNFRSYITENKKEYIEVNQTQLNIIYIYEGRGVPDQLEEKLRGVLFNCIGYVNEFLSSLRYAFDLNYIKEITVVDLPEYLTIEIDGEAYLYITAPLKLIEEREQLSSEALSKVQQVLATWEKYPEFGLVERFYSSAKHSMSSENFISAIIELQTSFEIFCRNTIRLIINKDGEKFNKHPNEVKNELEKIRNIPFRNLIEHNLSKKLGERLNFDNHPVVNNWYQKLYKVRNDIVHSGRFFVKNEEAQEAYDSYIQIRNYITSLLVKKSYLDARGTVDLKPFEKVYSNPSRSDEIWDKLKEHNLVPEGIEKPSNVN